MGRTCCSLLFASALVGWTVALSDTHLRSRSSRSKPREGLKLLRSGGAKANITRTNDTKTEAATHAANATLAMSEAMRVAASMAMKVQPSSEAMALYRTSAATLEGNATAALNKAMQPTPEEQQCEIQRQYTATPTHCPKGNNLIPNQLLQAHLIGFKQLWKDFRTQLPGQTCCMGINHQFSIYTTIKTVQPMVIIESGVAAGRGTWLLRYTAGPGVRIFSLDPGDPIMMYGDTAQGGRGWKDNSGMTTYLVNEHFQDLALARWDVLIPDPHVRAKTLVILDDHQSSIERLKMLRNWGFRWVFYEDNYPFQVATSTDAYTCTKMGQHLVRSFTKPLFGDAYSPNTVCGAVPNGWNFVLEKDRFGHKCKFLSLEEHGKNIKWFNDNIDNYFEFPAIFSRCSGLARQPLLGTDVAVLQNYGFPEPVMELWQYGHLFPALMQLRPLTVPEYFTGLTSNYKNIASIYAEIEARTWP